ncbi:MAG: SpoIIE family protein phosphatase [Methylotenera sp.]|nr:SpoIIE family protein phosphatase [Oligoflexia bacterium]
MMLTAISGSTVFFFRLYKNDKIQSLLESELDNTRHGARRLESLLSLANVISLDKVTESRDILFVYEDPCNRQKPSKSAVSELYKDQLRTLEVDPYKWVDDLDVFKACKELKNVSKDRSLTIVLIETPLLIPYIAALIQGTDGTRLAVFSMDGFSTSAGNTIFVLNAKGKLIWSADGSQYVQDAMIDTGIAPENLIQTNTEAVKSQASRIRDLGTEGLLSYAPVGTDWMLMSLSYKPSSLEPIEFALFQSITLMLGFFLLCLVVGRNLAGFITRPLNELRVSAEELGKGNFSKPFVLKGTDEFSVVKRAFNLMIDRIVNLLAETKRNAVLEAELEVALQVQQLLMPPPFIELNGIKMYSSVQAAQQCGGDWWGCLPAKLEGRDLTILMVGDVTGHGVASALITATVRGAISVLSTWIETNPAIANDPSRITQLLNKVVIDAAHGALAMTFMTLVVDHEKQTVATCNAGHNLPYLLIPSGKGFDLRSIGKSGVPLGYAADSDYSRVESYEWKPGTQLFLYTDGLIDNVNKEDKNLFDRKHLKKALQANGKLRGKALLNRILQERAEQVGNLPQADDLTAIVCDASFQLPAKGPSA